MQSQETIEYLIKQVGIAEAERGFKNLAKAQYESAKASTQHAQEMKAEARMAEVMERQAQRSAAAQAALAAATATATTATKTATTATAAAAQSGLTYSQSLQRGAISLGGFTSALSGALPALDGMGASVARASGVIGAMSQLAGGPVAIAIGVATAAMGVFALATEGSRKKLQDFNDEVEKSNELADKAFTERSARSASVTTAAAAALAQKARERVALQSVGLPVATTDFQANKEAIDREVAVMAAAGFGPGENVEAKKKALGIPFVNFGESAVRFAPTPDADQARRAEIAGRGTSAAISAQVEADALTQRLQQEIKDAKRTLEFAKSMQAAEKSGGRFGSQDQLQKQFEEQNAARARSIRDPAIDAHNQELKLYDEKEKRAQQFYGTLRDSARETYSAISGAIASSLASAIVGEDVSTKQVLKGLGKQVATMGLVNLLQAPVDLFWNPPKAAAEFAAGAAQLALGATLGAAGGGGSGGSGGGGGSPPPTVVAPSTDTGAKNPQPIVINNFNPSIIAPTHREGRLGREAMEAAKRQGRY